MFAVVNGKEGNKIYKTWAETQENTSGVSGVIFHKFKTMEECNEFINDKIKLLDSKKKYDGSIEYPCAFVDGSINQNTMKCGWGFIILSEEDKISVQDCGSGENEDYQISRNVYGELLSAIRSVHKAIELGYKELHIYYDYEGIEKWYNGEWTFKKNEMAKKYHDWMHSANKKIKLSFVDCKSHTGIKWNDEVDKLAKKGCGVV